MDEESGDWAGSPAPGIRPVDLAGIELRHAIPGRIRLRIPAIRGEPALARDVQRQLAALPVIRRVEVNPTAASVLVLYDPADSAAIAQLGHLIIPGLDLDASPRPGEVAAGPAPMAPAESVAEFGRELNRKIATATGGALDLKLLVPASLVVGGLIRLMAARKVPSPTWYDFLWFAFGTYFTLNKGGNAATPAAAGHVAGKESRPGASHGHPGAANGTGDSVHH